MSNHKTKKKQIIMIAVCIMIIVIVAGILALYFVGKSIYRKSLEAYPNSGTIEFHDIVLTIPDDYIRDSTVEGHREGLTRRWEQGSYKKIVTISVHNHYEIDDDYLESTKAEQETVTSESIEVNMIDFLGGKAIESDIPLDDGKGSIRYLIFNVGEYTYHFSVQGDVSDYDTIKASIMNK